MGEITEVFLEVWKRNPRTGLAEKHGTRTVWSQEPRIALYTSWCIIGSSWFPNQLRLDFLLSDFLIIDPAHE
jgi:hypothetical protein